MLSIQRLNEAGAARDSPLHHAKTSEAGGTKTTLSYLWRRLAASGVDVGALWAGICSVVVKSLVCVEGSIPNQPNRYDMCTTFSKELWGMITKRRKEKMVHGMEKLLRVDAFSSFRVVATRHGLD